MPLKKQTVSRKHGPPSLFAVVLIDDTPVRRRISDRFCKIMRELTAAKAVLQKFHETDAPAFEDWANSTFSTISGELDRVADILDEKAGLLDDVLLEISSGVHSTPRKAYLAAVQRRKAQKVANSNGVGADQSSESSYHDPKAPLRAMFAEFVLRKFGLDVKLMSPRYL